LGVADRGAEPLLLAPIEPAAHAIRAERKAEVLLDVGRPDAVGLFLVPEARERLAPGGLARFLVLPREEGLVDPRALVHAEHVVERRVVTRGTAKQVVLDDFVDGRAVDERVVTRLR